jgi:hypothetical protein
MPKSKTTIACFRNDTAFQILKDVRLKGQNGFKENAEKALIGAVSIYIRVSQIYNNFLILMGAQVFPIL